MNCCFTFQYSRKHCNSLFSKCKWIYRGVFEAIESVANCDQFIFFLIRELKSEMFWETLDITFNRLIKHLGVNPI